MKKKSVFILCILMLIGVVQTYAYSQESSTYYAGIYEDVISKKYGLSASITVYPEFDDYIIFYIKIQKGGPSYSSGTLLGRARIDNGVATFIDSENYCKLSLTFTKNSLIVRSLQGQYECGFGGGVIADGTYKRISKKIPSYYIDEDGKRVYFNELTYEE